MDQMIVSELDAERLMLARKIVQQRKGLARLPKPENAEARKLAADHSVTVLREIAKVEVENGTKADDTTAAPIGVIDAPGNTAALVAKIEQSGVKIAYNEFTNEIVGVDPDLVRERDAEIDYRGWSAIDIESDPGVGFRKTLQDGIVKIAESAFKGIGDIILDRAPQPNRAARRGYQKITKREPFGRVIAAQVDDDAETVRYLHATKGWRTRQATPHLFHAMGAGR